MPSVCFATIRLRRSLVLPIMRWFLCDTLDFTHLRIGHLLRLNQAILICIDKCQDCFIITDRFQQMSWLSTALLLPPFHHVLNTLFPASFHIITHNLIYGLHGLFPTSGENFELMNTLCESSVLINSPTEVNEKSLLSSGDTMCVVINASVSPAYVRLLWWGQRSKVRSNIINLLFAHMARRRFKCVDSASFSHRLIIQFCLLF